MLLLDTPHDPNTTHTGRLYPYTSSVHDGTLERSMLLSTHSPKASGLAHGVTVSPIFNADFEWSKLAGVSPVYLTCAASTADTRSLLRKRLCDHALTARVGRMPCAPGRRG